MERSIKIFNITYVIRAHADMRSRQKNIPDDLIVKKVEEGDSILQEQAVITVWVRNSE